MAEMDTVGIVEEIQALVSVKLQVVSYKWLSRNFSVSSNVAKRLLDEFVEKHGSGLEVVYTLSGWLKNNPSVYHIMLVSKPKLEESKGEFAEHCSVQVYSVQAYIPKDPAALWNAEFVQSEELFKQPPTIDNCLRDNRFCGVSNSFVKRNAEGMPMGTSSHQTMNAQQPQQRKIEKPSPNIGQLSPLVKEIKSESHEHDSKPTAHKENVPQISANKKKGQNDKSPSVAGGSLAGMWGRASAKPKPVSAPAETNTVIPKATDGAEAQICAREVMKDGRSDDDDKKVNVKRASNGEGIRKRRIVINYSDEEDDDYKDAVSLASPDPPKSQSLLDSKQNSKSSLDTKPTSKSSVLEKQKLNFDKEKEDKPKVKEDKDHQSFKEELSVVSKGKNSGISSSEKIRLGNLDNDASMKEKVTKAASNSPKRRKVLKTRIDERGREVNEVVWEGEEADAKVESDPIKKSDNTAKNTVNRPPAPTLKSPAVSNPAAAKKSPAVSNPIGKAAIKKAGNKDSKQGNILSFFKKS